MLCTWFQSANFITLERELRTEGGCLFDFAPRNKRCEVRLLNSETFEQWHQHQPSNCTTVKRAWNMVALAEWYYTPSPTPLRGALLLTQSGNIVASRCWIQFQPAWTVSSYENVSRDASFSLEMGSSRSTMTSGDLIGKIVGKFQNLIENKIYAFQSSSQNNLNLCHKILFFFFFFAAAY